jgi:hypothetical protein
MVRIAFTFDPHHDSRKKSGAGLRDERGKYCREIPQGSTTSARAGSRRAQSRIRGTNKMPGISFSPRRNL